MKTFLACLAVLLGAMAVVPRSEAATLTVDRTDDVMASACSDAVPNDCSLRGAIAKANELPGFDEIVVPAGTYTLRSSAAFPDDFPGQGGLDANAALLILEDVRITGAGAGSTIIQTCTVDQKTAPCPAGQGIARRVFAFSGNEMTAEIVDVTLRHGRAEGTGITLRGANGGAIYNDVPSTLTLRRVVVADNIAFTEGGGLFNRGPETLILFDTTVRGNVAPDGGGIANIHGGVTNVHRSTISGNLATNLGGGVFNRTGGSIVLTNTTVTGNQSGSDGGGIMNVSTMQMINATVTDNTCSGEGGCGVASSALARFSEVGNSIVAGNHFAEGNQSPNDCAGNFTSLGAVLIGNASGCAVFGGSVISGVDAKLGPLADNGGLTKTHALLPGSPAIDAAVPALCPAEDQRASTRPTDGDGNGVAICDIGAYEVNGSTPPGTSVPLERLLDARFELSRAFRAPEHFTERQARFVVPSGRTIDPFTQPFRLTLANESCGGVLSEFVLPAGTFRPLKGGAEAQAGVEVTDLVTGAKLNVFVHLTQRPGNEYLMVARIRNGRYACLHGQDDRTIGMSLTIGTLTAENEELFDRQRNGNLVSQ